MNGGVQNRLLAAFPPVHINQVVWCELIPKEKGEAGDSCGWRQGPIVCLGQQWAGSDCVWKVS